MPVHKVGSGYQWGNHGKVYRGSGAHEKASKQGQAAHANGYKDKTDPPSDMLKKEKSSPIGPGTQNAPLSHTEAAKCAGDWPGESVSGK